jgi:hypothetical protein
MQSALASRMRATLTGGTRGNSGLDSVFRCQTLNAVKSVSKRTPPAVIVAGRPWPLGIEWVEAEDAFNFALYSRRTNHKNLHVRGYKEEGATTTPFDMCVLNEIDRSSRVF